MCLVLCINHPELCERIEILGEKQIQVPTSKQIKCEMNGTNKDTLIESLKRKVKKLEKENSKQLWDQLQVAYAEVYKRLQ